MAISDGQKTEFITLDDLLNDDACLAFLNSDKPKLVYDLKAVKHLLDYHKIAFNVQNYALAGDVEYAYMLKGLKDSWYTVATNNVTFRNLNPGTYQFQVKTRMHNQEWSDEIASIDIHIAPPLWQTWWANLLYLLAFLTVLFPSILTQAAFNGNLLPFPKIGTQRFSLFSP